MPAVVRRGDVNSAGGAAIQGARSVLANGRPVVYPGCLLYTSPSPRDATLSRMPSSA